MGSRTIAPDVITALMYDKKHGYNLNYFPVENHDAEYFCDICIVEMSTSTSISSSGAVTALKVTHTLSLSFKGLRVMGTAYGVKGHCSTS
uniref:Uncharacterized protein n=1 Tax=Tanacetum cinerariifolium TaxID=118510 RepID=A0A699PYM0_TANCI|nr:hypothetical protein [Tanacetum cinerariifolium]